MSDLMDKGHCARYKVYFGVYLTYHLKYPVLKVLKRLPILHFTAKNVYNTKH